MNLESLANTDIDSWTEDHFDPDESRSKHIYNEQEYELETENVATTTKSTAAEEYKVRYNVLRQMYEQRLRGLVTQMHSVYADTSRDAAVQALGNSDLTTVFQPLRRQEVIQEAIESDAEHSYRKAAHDLAKTESALHRAKRKIHDLKRQVKHTHHYERDLTTLRSQLNVTTTELEQLKNKTTTTGEEDEEEEEEDDNNSMENSSGASQKEREDGNMESSKNDSDSCTSTERKEKENQKRKKKKKNKTKKLNKFQNSKNFKKKSKTSSSEHKKNNRKKRSRSPSNASFTSSDSDSDYASSSTQHIERHPSYITLSQNYMKMKSLLHNSESERLELRTKYIAIGKNVEQLIRTDQMQESDEVKRLSQKCAKLKTQMVNLVKKSKTTIRNCNLKITETNTKIENYISNEKILNEKINSFTNLSLHFEQEKEKVEATQNELNAAKIRITTLEQELFTKSNAINHDLDTARIEAREEQATRLTDAEVRCAKLEGEIIRVRSEQDERIEVMLQKVRLETQSKYEHLVEVKLNELKISHEKSTASHQHAKETEMNLRKTVNIKLKEISEDHIPIEQHATILRTKIESLESSHAMYITTLEAEIERENTLKMNEMRNNIISQYSVTEAELSRTIVELENQMKDVQRTRDNAIENQKEERTLMLNMKTEYLEEKQTRETMQQQLKEAANNLTRLKNIVLETKSKNKKLQMTINECEKNLNTSTETMKNKLKSKDEQHRTDLILLEEVRLQYTRAMTRSDGYEQTINEKITEITSLKNTIQNKDNENSELSKKFKETMSIKNDLEMAMERNVKEKENLQKDAIASNERAKISEKKYATLISDSTIEKNEMLKINGDASIELQKELRSLDLKLQKAIDEKESLQDRMTSQKVLGQEREAALVQQLHVYRKTVDETSVSAETAWSAQVEHLQTQLKDSFDTHAITTTERDQCNSTIRTLKSQLEEYKSDQELQEQKRNALQTYHNETLQELSSVQKEQSNLRIKHETLLNQSNVLKTTIQDSELQMRNFQIIINNHVESKKKKITEMTLLKNEISELKNKLIVLKDEKTVLQHQNSELNTNVEQQKNHLSLTRMDHETDVTRTMNEMEKRFVISETNLRTSIEKKTILLEKALIQIKKLEQKGSNGGDNGGRKGEVSSYEVESLKEEVESLKVRLECYRLGKLEMVAALEKSQEMMLLNVMLISKTNNEED